MENINKACGTPSGDVGARESDRSISAEDFCFCFLFFFILLLFHHSYRRREGGYVMAPSTEACEIRTTQTLWITTRWIYFSHGARSNGLIFCPSMAKRISNHIFQPIQKSHFAKCPCNIIFCFVLFLFFRRRKLAADPPPLRTSRKSHENP